MAAPASVALAVQPATGSPHDGLALANPPPANPPPVTLVGGVPEFDFTGRNGPGFALDPAFLPCSTAPVRIPVVLRGTGMRAQHLYGSQRVDDQLHAGAVANPAWLSPAFRPDLRGTRQAFARLADARLGIEGTVGADAARAQVSPAMAGIGSSGLQLVSRLALLRP